MKSFDRSRREAADRCLRSRYWGYQYMGQGIQSTRNDFDLAYGISGHEAMQALYSTGQLEQAISVGKDCLRVKAEEQGISPEPLDQTPLHLMLNEHMALLEAQLRAYAAVRLPKVLATYELMSTEQERTYRFPEDQGWQFMSRDDLLLKRRSDGSLFIWDFKFYKQLSDWTRKGMRYDTLTMSQVLGVEQELGEKLGGVIVEAIIKGTRTEYPRGSGLRQQNSPLIYGWRHPVTSQWAARYEWQCTESHWTEGKRPVMCEGNKTHKLSGYYKAKVWEEYPGGIAAWIDYLVGCQRELVEEQFIELMPIQRSDWEVEEWKLSTLYAEADISKKADWVNSLVGTPSFNKALAINFPKNTSGGKCLDCSFHEICWGSATPEDESLYRIRELNHPQEVQLDNANVGEL